MFYLEYGVVLSAIDQSIHPSDIQVNYFSLSQLYKMNAKTKENHKKEDKPNLNKPTIVRPDPNKLYRASIHRVKCQGAFYVKKYPSLNKSSVLCKGIQSRFETIHEYPPMKPAAALQTFQRSTSPLEEGENGFQYDNVEPQKENDILPHVIDSKWKELMNAMKDNSNVKAEKLEKVVESDASFYGTSNCYLLSLKPYYDQNGYNVHHVTDESHESIRRKANQASKSYSTINGESILKDMDEPKDHQAHEKSIIYAIAPKNEFGLTKRRVKNKDEGLACSSTTIKLGILEIHMASFEEYREVLESDSTSKDTSPIRDSQHLKKDSSIESLDFLRRFENMSNKIQSHMYKNMILVKEELENDFLNRTVKSAHMVVGNFQKTALRMKKTAIDIMNFFNDK